MCVKFSDDSAGLVSRQSDVTAQKHRRVAIKKREALLGPCKSRQHPSVKRTQFSLKLSQACTVHKIQDLSLAEDVVSFELESQKSMLP